MVIIKYYKTLVLLTVYELQIFNKECIENYKTTVPINLKRLDLYSPFIRKKINFYQASGLKDTIIITYIILHVYMFITRTNAQ